MNVLVFDIETIPDVENIRKIYDIPQLNDADVVTTAQTLRRQEGAGSNFFPLHLHRIIAIAAVLQTSEDIKVWSLGNTNATEKELIERFFSGIEKYMPTIVSWNGSGFDLPVLHYRALLHGVCASHYWETGDNETNFRYNNYLNRYHYRHMDLMDIFAAYQGRANAPLNDIALMLGFPGKMGIAGSDVWSYFQRGELETIRNYCETDVLNTYLIYLRFELIRGRISESNYKNQCLQLYNHLNSLEKLHLQEFIKAWNPSYHDNDTTF
jgi:hypothetical protein